MYYNGKKTIQIQINLFFLSYYCDFVLQSFKYSRIVQKLYIIIFGYTKIQIKVIPQKAPPPKKLTKKELKEKAEQEKREREEQERLRKEEEEEKQRQEQAENIVRDIYRYLTQLKAERKSIQNNQHKQLPINQNDVLTRNQSYINSIREIIHKKIEEINTQMVLYAEFFIEEKFAELTKKANEGAKGAFKIDDKTKQEVIKTFPPTEDFKYGIFIYPSNKPSGYRHKPNDYPEIQLAIDVPRSISIFIQKILYTSFDTYSPNTYSKQRVVGGVLDIEYLQMLPPPKKVNN